MKPDAVLRTVPRWTREVESEYSNRHPGHEERMGEHIRRVAEKLGLEADEEVVQADERVCRWCGEKFVARHRALYCGDACRRAVDRQRVKDAGRRKKDGGGKKT